MYNQFGQPMYANNQNIKPVGGDMYGKPINYFGPIRQPQMMPPIQNDNNFRVPPMASPEIKPFPMPPQIMPPTSQFDGGGIMHTQPFNPVGNPSFMDNSGGAGLPQMGQPDLMNQMQQQRWMYLRQLGIPY